MMLGVSARRNAYMLGVSLLAASQLPVVGDVLESVVGYEVMGVSVLTATAALVLYGTYLLFKRKLG